MEEPYVYTDLHGRVYDDTGQVMPRMDNTPIRNRTERRALTRRLTRVIADSVRQEIMPRARRVRRRMIILIAKVIALTVSTVLTVLALSPALRLPVVLTVLTLGVLVRLIAGGSYVDPESRRACTPTSTPRSRQKNEDVPNLRAISGPRTVACQPRPPTIEVISVKLERP